jgi:hypothetical protein
MTKRKHDLKYYLALLALILILFLWAWWAGNRDAQIDKVDGQALWSEAHYRAVQGLNTP